MNNLGLFPAPRAPAPIDSKPDTGGPPLAGGSEGAGAVANCTGTLAASAPEEPDVGVYELSGGVTIVAWLCGLCLGEKLEEVLIGDSRWSAKRIGTVTGHGCDNYEKCATKRKIEQERATTA